MKVAVVLLLHNFRNANGALLATMQTKIFCVQGGPFFVKKLPARDNY